MDIVTYKLGQKYADKVAAGFSSVRVDGLDIIFTLNDGKTATVTVPAPKDGQDGVSITNVSLNQQSHLICTLSDGTAIDAGLVHQGVDGKDGKDGTDGAPGQDGKDGQDGNGIISIEKTGTEGLVDTYTIYFTNGTTTTFTVTNGSGGSGTGNYTDLTNKPTINNVELNGNKTSSDLGLQPAGNYVTNTDYATSNVGGVIKVANGDYGLTVDEGALKGTVRTVSQYENMSSKGLVCKGTLENVLEDKGYQEELVSGTNIKTINNVSILGSGNIDIEGGEGGSKPTKNFIHVSMDDTSSTVDYINSASNASIYGNSLLSAMRDMHEEHNMVFSLYLYKNLSFDTSTANGAAKKAELYAARDWLKFGYHKIGGSFCDQLSYADAKSIYTTFANAILTHCGSLDSVDRMPRLDYFRSGKSGLQGFRDAPAGLLGVLGPDDVRTDNIYLPVENQKWLSGYENRDSSVTTNWYPKDYITDHEIGIKYFKTDLRLDWISQPSWFGQNHDKPSGEKAANANAVYQSLMDWYKDGRHSDTFCPMIIFFHEVEWTSGRMNKAYFEKIAQFAEEVGMDFDYPQNRFYDMPNRYDINVGGGTPETKELKSIVVLTPPNKTDYEVGETFNTGGMVVAANYETTTTHTPSQEIISTYTYSPTGALTLSDTEITITYSGKTATQAISVVNPGTISYTITTNVTNGTYSGATKIYDGGTAQVTIVPNSGYDIPTSEDITIVGASYTYNNGIISLSSPTTDVTISAICPESQVVTDTIAGFDVTLVSQVSDVPVSSWVKDKGFSGGGAVVIGSVAVAGRGITINSSPKEGYCIDVQGKSRIRITDTTKCPFIAGFMLNGKGATSIASNSDTTHANWNKASYWWTTATDGAVINLNGTEKYWYPYIKVEASPTATLTDQQIADVISSIVIE